jgi:hypothetical protein
LRASSISRLKTLGQGDRFYEFFVMVQPVLRLVLR